MIQLNFKEFELPLDIAGRQKRIGDVREGFANSIYVNIRGIEAHDLALKIYHSEGVLEYSDTEAAIIKEVADKFALPPFIDAIRSQLEKQTTPKEEKKEE